MRFATSDGVIATDHAGGFVYRVAPTAGLPPRRRS